jgi:mannitol/fructose-specific phosphotransferase system IIA component (Ntr-type)
MVPSALDSSLFIPDLKVKRKESVLHELVDCAHRVGALRQPEVVRGLLAVRESLGSTSPGRGFAIPSAHSLAVAASRLVVARSRRGIDWGAPDGQPVHLVFLLLSPAEFPDSAHFEWIGRLAAVARLQRHRQKMLDAAGFEPIAAVLRETLP